MKIRVTEHFRQPKGLNCFYIEEILPEGKTSVLNILQYDDTQNPEIWGRDANLKTAMTYAKQYEQKAEKKEPKILYETPE